MWDRFLDRVLQVKFNIFHLIYQEFNFFTEIDYDFNKLTLIVFVLMIFHFVKSEYFDTF
jgi:hypothetical protein